MVALHINLLSYKPLYKGSFHAEGAQWGGAGLLTESPRAMPLLVFWIYMSDMYPFYKKRKKEIKEKKKLSNNCLLSFIK